MDDNRPGLPSNRFPGTSGAVERHTIDFHRRVHRWYLLNFASKPADDLPDCFRCEMTRGAILKDGTCGIKGISGLPQAQLRPVFLVPRDKILRDPCPLPDEHGKQARCSRVQRTSMADFGTAEQTSHLGHHIVGGPSG